MKTIAQSALHTNEHARDGAFTKRKRKHKMGIEKHLVCPLGTKAAEVTFIPDEDKGVSYWFWCKGCESHHRFVTKNAKGDVGPTWTFNGDMEKPTFKPSLVYRNYVTEKTKCHLFLTKGIVHYLADSDHEFAGRLLPVESPT